MKRFLLLVLLVVSGCSMSAEISQEEIDLLYSNEFLTHEIDDENVLMKFYKLEKLNSKYDGTELVVIKLTSPEMKVKHVNKKGKRNELFPTLGDSNSVVIVNGGYFGYNHKERLIPLGLEVVDSIQKSSLSKWSIGGVFHENSSGFQITPIDSFSMKTKMKHAIQSKPIVVLNGEIDIYSKKSKIRNRTAICLDKFGNVIIAGVFNNGTGAMTMYDFAKVLTYKKGATPLVDIALAMDGGKSSHLYIPSLKRSWGSTMHLYVPNVVVFNQTK